MPLSILFQGVTQPEALKVIFDGRDKVHLASSKTQYKLVDVSDKFYDDAEEKEVCMTLSDEEFLAHVIYQFAGRGYKFVKIEDG